MKALDLDGISIPKDEGNDESWRNLPWGECQECGVFYVRDDSADEILCEDCANEEDE